MKYLIRLIIIAACIGVFMALIRPRYEAVQSARTEINNYASSLSTAEKLKSSREELIARYNSIPKVDLDNIKTLLPDSVDNIRLIIQLDSLATKNGLSSLRNVDYKTDDSSTTNTASGKPVPGGVTPAASTTALDAARRPYGEFIISFQTTGQYKNFLAFISDLEQNLRVVDVTAVTFSGNTSNSNSSETSVSGGSTAAPKVANNMSYKVTLKTYWLKK